MPPMTTAERDRYLALALFEDELATHADKRDQLTAAVSRVRAAAIRAMADVKFDGEGSH